MKPIQDVFAIAKRGHHFAALFVVILALAVVANADNSHRGKKGSLKITVATEVGGTMLQPGDYEVKEANSPAGPVLEFVHLFDNIYAPEGVSRYEQEVVARVPFTTQTLSSLPKRTRLLPAPDTTNAVALEIRGSGVDYLIASPQLAASPGATVDRTSGGSHE